LNELTIQGDGLKVSISVTNGGDVWQVTRAAFDGALNACQAPRPENFLLPSIRKEEENLRAEARRVTKTDQIRAVARGLLSDGRVHERREISKACRDAGLDPQPLTKALEGHFERGANMDGRPTYRDTTVPSPYLDPRSVPEDEKPAWLRNHPPAHEDGDLELIEASRNGAS
jgi:hypothetical protein